MWSYRVYSVLAKRRLEWIREKRQRRRRLNAAYVHGRKKHHEKRRQGLKR